ncbi:MAG: hypothetical protein ACYDDU_14905 [Dermatophilaceae bacterium]
MRRPQLVGALVAAVIAMVASVAVAVGARSGPSSWSTRGQGQWSGMMGGYGQGQGAGMMGGYGYGQGQGAGMMGGQGQGAGISAGSMMGSMGMVWLAGDGVAVSGIPAARARATTAAAPAGLHPGEVMWFDNGFYVELKDVAGQPATEVIVDPRTGAVSTEPGPAMMWNTRFGMMRAGSNSAGLVTSTKARAIAASWLAANQAGTTIGSIDAYPGYFTIDLQRGGVVSGMMSVSSVTGAVWYHVWHGAFIAMEDS